MRLSGVHGGEHMVPVDGGEVWAHDTAGTGPVAVLLHPGVGDSRIWEPVVHRLASGAGQETGGRPIHIADLTGLYMEVLERDGDPARQLACVAAEKTADAIVIGAPEHLMHRFAGSVPAWLARHARCPVVIVP